MSINEMYEIAERIEKLAWEASNINKSRQLILAEIFDLADEIRDEADEIEKHMSEGYAGA